MKIYVYPGDLTGCGHFRLIWPAEVLKAEGYDIEIVPPNDRKDVNIQWHNDSVTGEPVIDEAYCPEDADVLVMQRITHRFMSNAVPFRFRRKVA